MSRTRRETDEMVVAICTNRLEDVRARWEENLSQLGEAQLLIYFDAPSSPTASAVFESIRSRGGVVIEGSRTRGLSAARNEVLDARPTSKVLFIDDDVLLQADAIDAIRVAFQRRSNVVGARLSPPSVTRRWPWYFSTGQMHLVGWHTPAQEISIWGGCMGIDAVFAHRHGIRFDAKLGRTGRRLESGDDTSFIAAMKRAGAVESRLSNVQVIHDIDMARLNLRYLVRRAYWQGRSEIRRENARLGLKKEWHRHRRSGLPLAILYTSVEVLGMLREVPTPSNLRRMRETKGKAVEYA